MNRRILCLSIAVVFVLVAVLATPAAKAEFPVGKCYYVKTGFIEPTKSLWLWYDYVQFTSNQVCYALIGECGRYEMLWYDGVNGLATVTFKNFDPPIMWPFPTGNANGDFHIGFERRGFKSALGGIGQMKGFLPFRANFHVLGFADPFDTCDMLFKDGGEIPEGISAGVAMKENRDLSRSIVK